MNAVLASGTSAAPCSPDRGDVYLLHTETPSFLAPIDAHQLSAFGTSATCRNYPPISVIGGKLDLFRPGLGLDFAS
jgi:hypothetical protein